MQPAERQPSEAFKLDHDVVVLQPAGCSLDSHRVTAGRVSSLKLREERPGNTYKER